MSTPSTTPSLLNSKAQIFLSKNVPLMPLTIASGTTASQNQNDGSVLTSELQTDKSIKTTLSFDDGSKVTSTTNSAGVTTTDSGLMATYNAYTTNAKLGGLLLLLFVILVIVLVVGGKSDQVVAYVPMNMPVNVPMRA